MNGKTITLGAILLLLGLGAGYYFSTGKLIPTKTTVTTTISVTETATPSSSSAPTATVTTTPTPDDKAALLVAIKASEVARYGADANLSEYTVTKIEGNYAKGQVSASGGGAQWFAAKVNGVWKIVFVGNGSVQCSDLTNYPNFPNSMIPECWDDANQKLVVR